MVLAVDDGVRYLLFPLLVLLTGAAVTSLLVPWLASRRDDRRNELARRRDDHRKALEVKTGLVSEISQTVMDFIMAIQFDVGGEVSQEQKADDEAYKTWEVRSAVLGTKLEAYFPRKISDDWEALEDELREVYRVTRIHDSIEREREAIALLAKFPPPPQPTGDDPDVREASRSNTWKPLKAAVLRHKTSLIKDVLSDEGMARVWEPNA
jgi:hypothetical protein